MGVWARPKRDLEGRGKEGRGGGWNGHFRSLITARSVVLKAGRDSLTYVWVFVATALLSSTGFRGGLFLAQQFERCRSRSSEGIMGLLPGRAVLLLHIGRWVRRFSEEALSVVHRIAVEGGTWYPSRRC